VYVYTEEIILAVNVAIATGRPLLVRGPSGSGKSSLARSVALSLGWRYYEEVITSRTQAQDLLWRFDTLRRLNDAQAEQIRDTAAYIEPGKLWWAFDRESARARGVLPGSPAVDPSTEPGLAAKRPQPEHPRAVVLLDEIDKADPDVPNSLLVPLGSWQFPVPETGAVIVARPDALPLLIITTNDERQLPNPFLRRCIIHTLPGPDEDRLVAIATAHFKDGLDETSRGNAARVTTEWERDDLGQGLKASTPDEIFRDIAKMVDAEWKRDDLGQETKASVAEYLDAIGACLELKIRPDDADAAWQQVRRAALSKRQGPAGAR
jgi:MoxR-like ATPase